MSIASRRRGSLPFVRLVVDVDVDVDVDVVVDGDGDLVRLNANVKRQHRLRYTRSVTFDDQDQYQDHVNDRAHDSVEGSLLPQVPLGSLTHPIPPASFCALIRPASGRT